MIKYINSIFSGLFVKVFGLLFLILINKHYGASLEVGKIIYFWSIAIFIQSVLILPILYYSVSIKNPIFMLDRQYLTIFIAIIFILFFIDSYTLPFSLWVLFLLINLKIDYILLRTNHNVMFLYSYALKNIIPLLFIKFISLEYIFYFFLSGEIIKTFIFKNLIKKTLKAISFDKIMMMKYIAYLFLTGSIILMDKTFIYIYNPKFISDFEILYRFFEIFLTGVTTGLVPLFINKIGSKSSNNIIKISFLLSLGIVIIIFSILPFIYTYLYSYFNFNLSLYEVEIVLYIAILLLLPMVILTYYRRIIALKINSDIYFFYFFLIIEKIILYFYLYTHITNIILYLFVNLLIIFSLESFYIKSKIKGFK